MNLLSALTKSPIQFELNGTQIELSPLTMQDFGDFLQWIQFRDYHNLKKQEDVPSELLVETLKECAKRQLTMTSPEFQLAAETPEGLTRLAYLSARHRHPDMPADYFGSVRLDQLHVIGEALAALSGLVTTKANANQKKVAAVRNGKR